LFPFLQFFEIISRYHIECMKKQTFNDGVEGGVPYWAKKVLTFEEACEYTGLSKSYLYKLTAKREVPHFKPRAKMLYFNRDELEVWMQRGRVTTNEEMELTANASVRRTVQG